MYEQLYQYFSQKYEIEKEEFDKIAIFFKPKAYGKNEIILTHGQVCTSNYFVNDGCLRFYSINRDGSELTRYFAFPGKFGTALSSLIDQRPSFEYIESLEESNVLEISRNDFFHLVDEIPAVNFIYRDILEMAYVTSQERIYGLQGDTALQRLRWLMDYQPKIMSKISNKMIASYLGITPYTLSRLKAKL